LPLARLLAALRLLRTLPSWRAASDSAFIQPNVGV
jgi:hypothetical protein